MWSQGTIQNLHINKITKANRGGKTEKNSEKFPLTRGESA